MPTAQHGRDQLDYKTLCDAVFIKLRDEILAGSLKPGEKLSQTDLAKRFGISRMPVRDAIRKLESEGLVTIYTDRGAVVVSMDMEECQEVFHIREALETMAARMAAPNIIDLELVALRELEAKMEKTSRAGKLNSWLEMDFQFHSSAFAPCASPRLLKLIAGFWNATHHFRRLYCTIPGKISRSEQSHRDILAVLEARDGEGFEQLTREIIRESVRSILSFHPHTLAHPPEGRDEEKVSNASN